MSAEWVPGTIDPANSAVRGEVSGSWLFEVPEEFKTFNEKRDRHLVVQLAQTMDSQAAADFLSDVFKLKNRINLSKEAKNE